MAILSLGQMVTNLRLELGQSSSAAAGINMRDQLVYLLNRTQEELALSYTWPGMTVDRDIPIQIGARYYAYPTDLSFENITDAWLVWGSLFGEMKYGIGPDEFALWNSNTGFLSWPVERWMHHSDDNTFELWPVPSEAPPASANAEAARIRFRGTKSVAPMVADSDLCTLPATAIVLFAAAERLADNENPRAKIKLGRAENFVRQLKVRQGSNKRGPFVLGGGSHDQAGSGRGRIGLDYIPQNYGSGPGR